ncbi:MAG TPA: sigma-70 family RNA polymerase sigma factor [Gemmatimonadales bacterium]|nr:sigma-70 family RNA polymerase sigma factor [Gemmatimonadales bacterium]
MTHPAAAPADFELEALPHLDTLYRVALRLTGEDAAAQDLVQETMLRALRGWNGFRAGSNARAWLVTILRNTFINDYRRRRREPVPVDLEAVDPWAIYRAVADTDPEGEFFSRIVDARVLEAVDRLPPDFREVLVLSDMEGLGYAEIAAALEIPIGTLKSRLFRARRLLQRELYDYAVAMGYLKPGEAG